MNMLPINSEWKRRIRWAEKQQREQKVADKAKEQAKKKMMQKIYSVQED
ncbi:MAG: hypothetical protein K0R55_284 [Sporomusa sp.]|nr:hypothetical protein [Sporomusa sp.]